MKQKIKQIVLDCCTERNEIAELQIDVALEESAPLFGVDGVLDSIDLVSLIIAIEQAIEDEIGIIVTLADARAASRENTPFKTIGTLVDYATLRVQQQEQVHE